RSPGPCERRMRGLDDGTACQDGVVTSIGPGFSVFAIEGLPEFVPGDDLAGILGDALEGVAEEGDILAVTSKIVSKVEGRIVAAADREDAITAETVRLVAER